MDSNLKEDSAQEVTDDSEPVCKKAKLTMNTVENNADLALNTVQGTPATDENLKNNISDNCDNISIENISKNQNATKVKLNPLTELQAGITEYFSDHEGFNAVIKQRFSDFIVNEVDLDGNVIHLTNLQIPEDDKHEENLTETFEITTNCPEITEEILQNIKQIIINEDKISTVDIDAPKDKDRRTLIHLVIKQSFPQLETKTLDKDGRKIIQVLWRTGNSRGSVRDEWPKSKKACPYVKFVLYKENKDTMDALGLISKILKVKESLFQFAGTKDKRAKTTQEITANRIHPKKLAFLNKVLRNMAVGNFRYVKEPLKLGQLSGNEFTIVLRNVQASSETVDTILTLLKSNGFINYYGMQRFGTTSVPTYKVGSALLHGDWDKAINLILMPRDDHQSKDEFQQMWMKTHDPKATLELTPKYCGLERNLLSALNRKMKPFNALEQVARNTRLLYVHSYQAFVWNLMVSKRLRELGKKVVVGDLVLPSKLEQEIPLVVTLDTLDKYSLLDVVLPLPGYDVIYPENEVKEWYKSTLEADGLDINKMKRPQKDYSLPGAYRHIVVRPSEVTWSHHHYEDYTLPLVLSDLDLVNKVDLPIAASGGKLKSVVLKLRLPTSCYATMALREALRIDTSAAHQMTLNAL
ncbi:multisubstrate pseudouridine synthase 7 [Bulinus truncatus]|nr:multisubstrate pseudouridine synthase 7 [Bulinus truncatus]